ncbi:trigger factor [Haliangium ochraceum]|uniref:Trigger factor n=1 Tax=Haliangium ochraceum (strain DSM 14365 / JCM 11303 / SMP-2) TaxID=502025 RepID=D0LVB2_HALO1|nr:trigger factor [Haliangium ochraceum]ACY17473.1 trigger factor [Haliangium ochraceum DSM 14365]
MQVRIEDVSPVEKKLIVEVPWDTVNGKLSDMYRKLSRSVQIKGFRKGKVPMSVVKQMYGKHVRSEVTEQLVREGFLEATSGHELAAVSEPRVETLSEIRSGEPFSFEAVVEVRGEVEAKDYKGMALTRRPLVVEDEEIATQLEQLRQENAELQPIEGRERTAKSDVLTMSLEGTIGEQPVNQPQIHVDLGDAEHEPLPGMIDALTDLPLDAKDHKLELTIPEDFQEQSVAGQAASFTITITDARVKTLPELDDDFAKDLERGESLDELRQSIRADIEKQRQSQIDRELKQSAIKELVKRNEIPVAPTLVDRGVEFQMQRLAGMMGMPPGSDPRQLLTDEMREQMRPSALEEIRGQLLLEAIADQESIEISDEDLDAHLSEIAERRNEPVARLRAQYERDGKLDSIRYQLRQDKALDLIVEHAEVTEAEPEPEPADDAADAESGSDDQG